MYATDLLWLIPLLPFAGSAALALAGPRAPKAAVNAIGLGAPGASLALALAVLWDYLARLNPEPFQQVLYAWTAGDLALDVAFLLDPLSAVMTFVVTFVGFLIHVYSVGYMGREAGYQRYFAYLNLFMGAMLLLVLGSNFLVMFVGWEGVGLCSYLLIGFYYKEGWCADAGRKAFVVNRIGDFGFLVGLFALFAAFGTLDFRTIFDRVAADPSLVTGEYALGLSLAGFVALCLFIGATGKSAQIPLHVWLPDAMAGPTPVSALIHAATMVTAGVYMVARTNILYQLAGEISLLVAAVGAVTAIFAATIGLAQNDIKKVLAYSTVSQLGYMFLAAGLGAYGAAIFHLMTHAFFKALLFLGSGSVIHAMGGEQDMRKMGGLARHLPITRWTFWIGCMAISGIPLFSGFFSKDEILAAAAGSDHWLLWGIGFLTAGLTACYMFRAYRLTFLGEFRGSEEQRHHLHESPTVMTVPLAILAVGAATAGLVGIPAVLGEKVFGRDVNWFHHLLEPVVAAHPAGFLAGAHHLAHGIEIGLMLLSIAIAAAGILLARSLFRTAEPLAGDARIAAALGGYYRLLADKYRIDELYDRVVVRPLAALARALWKAVDGFVIDGLLHTSAFLTALTGDLGRFTTTGNARHYVLYFLVGLIVLFWWAVS